MRLSINKRFLFFGVFAAIIILVWGGYLLWTNFRYDPIKAYEKAEKAYIEAMTTDTYGGKTPQETLDLFVEALRVGDVELASKYFLLDENLSRERWIYRLNDIKNRSLLTVMADDIKRLAVPDLQNTIGENDYRFVLYADGGDVGARLDMQFNTYSKIWKIESL